MFEEFPCDNREQLEKREMELVRSIDCVNKTKWRRTRTEYMREYRENNREHLNKYKRDFYHKKKHDALV